MSAGKTKVKLIFYVNMIKIVIINRWDKKKVFNIKKTIFVKLHQLCFSSFHPSI